MNARRKRLFLKILPYPVIFMIGGVMYFFIEIGLLGSSEVYPATGVEYDPLNSILMVVPMTGILGLLLGLIEELTFKKRFIGKSFVVKITAKTLLYISIFVIIQFVSAAALNIINTGKSFLDAEVYETVFLFFKSFAIVSIIFYAGFIISISLFFTEIVDYLGLDVVGNFFSGKYSKPVSEDRVFMFLDMKDSTTIAERIGHEKHFELMNDYYNDMSDAIVETNGSIYQYVGDEIVVSWAIDQGLRDSNCLKCFFQVEQMITKRADYYESTYGVIPSFKAGLHCGEVTRGQIGRIKREMLYTGDVLNATSRIQGLCNELGVNLLISGKLNELLKEPTYVVKPMGALELKGRQKKEELFEVELAS